MQKYWKFIVVFWLFEIPISQRVEMIAQTLLKSNFEVRAVIYAAAASRII